jgi:hypothetical protein
MTTFVWGTSGVYGSPDPQSLFTRIGAIRDIEVQITREFVLNEPVWDHATAVFMAYAQEAQTALDHVRGNSPYAARARYHDVFGNSSAWSPVSYRLTAKDITAPAVPTGVTATSDGLGLHITWIANTESDLAYYQVRTSPSVDGAPSVWTIADVRVNSYVLPAVTGPYWVQVQAVDSSGNTSGWS